MILSLTIDYLSHHWTSRILYFSDKDSIPHAHCSPVAHPLPHPVIEGRVLVDEAEVASGAVEVDEGGTKCR